MMRAFRFLALVWAAILTGLASAPRFADAQFPGYAPPFSLFGNNATPEGVPGYATSAGVQSLTIGVPAGTATSPNIEHVIAQGALPTLAGCGTQPFATGDSLSGAVQLGTGGPVGCVITFGVAYINAPRCVVTWESNLAVMKYVATNGGITLTQTAASSDIVDYHCIGRQGG